MFQQAIGLRRGFDLIPYFANLFLLKLAVDIIIIIIIIAEIIFLHLNFYQHAWFLRNMSGVKKI